MNTPPTHDAIRLSGPDGETWQLHFQPRWPARELRDLLLMRRVADLPALRLFRVEQLREGAPALESGVWLVSERAPSEEQARRCRARGLTWFATTQVPPVLAEHCARLPLTVLEDIQPSRLPARMAGMAMLLLVVGLLLALFVAHGQREKRIAEQNRNAVAVLQQLHSPQAPRAPVERVHAALVELGVPALLGDEVVVRPPPFHLAAQAQAELLDAALAPRLRADVGDLAALQAYLQAQARRAGQKRLIMSAEQCAHRGERVIPLPGNRAYVLRLEARSPWGDELAFAGVERIEPAQLHDCVALAGR